jgi:hypothetical protein
MSRGRSLTDPEQAIVTSVFQSSLPPPFLQSKVMLHDSIGIGDRPYTSISAGIGRYEINMGIASLTREKTHHISKLRLFMK